MQSDSISSRINLFEILSCFSVSVTLFYIWCERLPTECYCEREGLRLGRLRAGKRKASQEDVNADAARRILCDATCPSAVDSPAVQAPDRVDGGGCGNVSLQGPVVRNIL